MCFFGSGNSLSALKGNKTPVGSTSASGLMSTRNEYNSYATAEAEAGRNAMTHMDWAKSGKGKR